MTFRQIDTDMFNEWLNSNKYVDMSKLSKLFDITLPLKNI